MSAGLPPGVRAHRQPGILEAFLFGADAAPVLYDSPHSGRVIPPDFVTKVGLADLRTGEDAFVDDLVSGCLTHGIGLIKAEFPRSYIDVNRAIDDIDEAMLEAPWPDGAQPTDKSRRGFGLIRREILADIPLYDRLLGHDEIRCRIDGFYIPYHRALEAALDALHATHGAVFHVDWHSMKPVGVAMNVDAGKARPDFVVSDREGLTADPKVTRAVADWLRERGYEVSINAPYKGAELVCRHGTPARGRHSIQVEINRKLYLDPERMLPTDGYDRLKSDLTAFSAWIAGAAGDF